jgi:flavin-dependent dehydrogenase
MISLTPETYRSQTSVDVFIIGGGPAGSTAGAWLGKQGVSTLLCEKEKFPRFHIGESLLPNGNRILKETGVWEKVQAAGFVKKYGALFTLPNKSREVRNVFSEGLVKDMDQTYQVERSRFDKILLDHAEASGCQVRQQTKVKAIIKTNDGWTLTIENVATGEEQQISAKWILDASGRNCIMGRILNLKKELIPYPGRFAVFNHFTGFTRATGEEGGDIIVLRLQDAWFWAIPISDSVTSVGVVAQKWDREGGEESREEFFWKKVHESSFLTDALSKATPQQEYRIESDYCFSYESFAQDRVLLTGDAASFIDPVFSSGVYLALESGLLAAKTVQEQLAKNRSQVSPRVYQAYTKSMKGRIHTIRLLIEAYYDNRSFEVFMVPRPKFKIPQAINSVLAGCTDPPFKVRWRFWLFRKICDLNKKRRIAAPVRWKSFTQKPRLKKSLEEII